MKKIQLKKTEKIKIFLNEYYFGFGNWVTILRMFGGPFMLLMGMFLYNFGQNKIHIAYGGALILFGFYYFIRPVMFIWMRKEWLKRETVFFEFSPDKLVIQVDKSTSELDYSELKSIKSRKSYYAFTTKDNQSIYFPKYYLDPQDEEKINTLIKSRIELVLKEQL
jgi:hypothetical protein